MQIAEEGLRLDDDLVPLMVDLIVLVADLVQKMSVGYLGADLARLVGNLPMASRIAEEVA